MAFMLATTLPAMWQHLWRFWNEGAYLLLGVSTMLFVVSIWLVVESVLAIRRYRRGETTDVLRIAFSDDVST
jgi:hypothetical protein